MQYDVLVSQKVSIFMSKISNKTKKIIKKNLEKLYQPYPGRGLGDKEKIIVDGEVMYRLHISRSYTAFYIIDEDLKVVRILEILTIESAHKKYGF